MKLERGAIIANIPHGALSLQIPDVSLYIGTYTPTNANVIDYPDEWFCRLRSVNTYKLALPTSKRQHTFLYLTESGWLENKADMKAEYLKVWGSSLTARWDEFERRVTVHFVEMAKQGYSDAIQNHRRKI